MRNHSWKTCLSINLERGEVSMFTKNINREVVFQAIQYIEDNERFDSQKPRKYDLYYDSNYYSPSCVIMFAYGFANREELIPTPNYFADIEVNQFLIDLGFEIVERKAIHDIFDPYTQFFSGSWGN
jgi:hypothetical protein